MPAAQHRIVGTIFLAYVIADPSDREVMSAPIGPVNEQYGTVLGSGMDTLDLVPISLKAKSLKTHIVHLRTTAREPC